MVGVVNICHLWVMPLIKRETIGIRVMGDAEGGVILIMVLCLNCHISEYKGNAA